MPEDRHGIGMGGWSLIIPCVVETSSLSWIKFSPRDRCQAGEQARYRTAGVHDATFQTTARRRRKLIKPHELDVK